METITIPKAIGFDIAMQQAIAVPVDNTFSCPNLPQNVSVGLSTGAWLTIGAITVIVIGGGCVYYFNKKAEESKNNTSNN